MRQSRIGAPQPLLRKAAAGVLVSIILVTGWACSRDSPPPTPAPAKGPSTPATPVTALSPDLSARQAGQKAAFFDRAQDRLSDNAQGMPLVYQSRGRRDPFRPLRLNTAQEGSTVNLKLTGIIKGSNNSYYALVESDSSPGIGYVIRENDMIESARVVKITKDSVVFEVQTKTAEKRLLTRYVQKQMQPVESR